jgi:hypothetical protein
MGLFFPTVLLSSDIKYSELYSANWLMEVLSGAREFVGCVNPEEADVK